MTNQVMQDEFQDEMAEEIETDQYLVFSAKSQEYAFQVIRILETSSVLNTTEIPNAPPYIEGISNFRGKLATVINFRKKFGFEAMPHDEDTRIIMSEKEGFPIGILVDSIEEVIKVPAEMIQKLPEATGRDVTQEFITGVAMLPDRFIILLDIDKVLSDSELIKAQELSQLIESVKKTGEKPDQQNKGPAPGLDKKIKKKIRG